jgi:hypothetical protein
MGEPEQARAAGLPGMQSAAARAGMILTPDQRVRVFISSTLGELAAERAAARRAITRLHLVPVFYESGARPHPPRSLAGAAEGLRRRAGFSTWPMLRQGEAELAAQIRQALGDDRFGQAFAAGTTLSQQEAVAAVRGQPQ